MSHANVKVVLYTSKKLSNGEYPVLIRITKDRKVKYLSTGVKCSKELWNFTKNKPSSKHPNCQSISVLIKKKELEAAKLIYDAEGEDIHLTAHEITANLKKKKVNNPSISDYFDLVIKRLSQSGKIKNSEIYKDTKRNINNFKSIAALKFSDIDVLFLNHFEENLRSNGKGSNTIFLYLRTLRALMNKARTEGYCHEKYYPFKEYSLTKYANIKTPKRAISKDEIGLINQLNPEGENLKLARHIFLFSFYCRGMNFIDIAYLKWDSIHVDRLTYRRQKTKELFNIQLLEPALKILKFYKPKTLGNRDNYIFPILMETHVSPRTQYNRIKKMLRQINADLKTLATKAGITANLTTYVARHSYGTIMRKGGISTAVISESMGHDSEKTTQIYLDSFENNLLDEASKSIL